MKKILFKYYPLLSVVLSAVLVLSSVSGMVTPLSVQIKNSAVPNKAESEIIYTDYQGNAVTENSTAKSNQSKDSNSTDGVLSDEIADDDYIVPLAEESSTESSDIVLPEESDNSITPQDAPEGTAEENGTIIVPAAINNIMRDALPSLITTKIYTFTAEKRGAVKYSFNHVNATGDDCQWFITLYEEYSPDGSGITNAWRELYKLPYTKNGTTAITTSIGVLPGNYRISVSCISGYTDDKYDITIGYAAADNYETEPNDSISRYTYLTLNKTMIGSASRCSDDVLDNDTYMIYIASEGYTVVYFEHEEDALLANSNSLTFITWRVTVTDENGNEYYSATAGTAKESINSGVMGLSEGYYYITVSANTQCNVDYNLTATFNEDSNVERELNDTPETATPIVMNTQTVGALTLRNKTVDRDYFSFSMESDGFVVIGFVHEALETEQDGWNISIENSNGDVMYKTVSGWTQNVLQSPYIGLRSGDYVIKVDSDNLYISSIVYRVSLVTVADSQWEAEPNNDMASANEITFGSAINGAMVELGVDFDVDYFSFVMDSPGTVTAVFDHLISVGADKEGWLLEITDENGNVMNSAVSQWEQESVMFNSKFLPAGKYYLTVKTGLYFNNSRYVLTVLKN